MDTATVTIDVACVNDPPVALDDDHSTTEGTVLAVGAPGVLGNDSDVDGDALVVDSHDAASAAGGTVAVASDGSFTYTPPAGLAGTDNFGYVVGDGNGASDTAVVTITVEATHNRAIEVEVLEAQLDGTDINGLVRIDNDSGRGVTVQVVAMEVTAEYRVPGDKGWTTVGVGACTFDPAPTFVVEEARS